MKQKIKCPLCDAEFEVEMPDFLQDADCMYEGKVRCKNCNNMVAIFTNPQVISEPQQLEQETHLRYKNMTIEEANKLPTVRQKQDFVEHYNHSHGANLLFVKNGKITKVSPSGWWY